MNGEMKMIKMGKCKETSEIGKCEIVKRKCTWLILSKTTKRKKTRSMFGNAECVLHTHVSDKKMYWKGVHTLAYMLVSAKKKCAQVLLERDECALSFVLRSTYVPLARRRRWVAH